MYDAGTPTVMFIHTQKKVNNFGHKVSPDRGPLTVQTGPVAAAVQLLLTVGAGVAGRAAAGVASGHRLHAGAAVEAGAVSARHCNDLAVLSVKALWAGAGVVILKVLWTEEEEPLG